VPRKLVVVEGKAVEIAKRGSTRFFTTRPSTRKAKFGVEAQSSPRCILSTSSGTASSPSEKHTPSACLKPELGDRNTVGPSPEDLFPRIPRMDEFRYLTGALGVAGVNGDHDDISIGEQPVEERELRGIVAHGRPTRKENGETACPFFLSRADTRREPSVDSRPETFTNAIFIAVGERIGRGAAKVKKERA